MKKILRSNIRAVSYTHLDVYKRQEQMLLPGYTDYKYRVQYQKYIVTDRLQRGENVLAAAVGDGWYRGCLGIGSKRNNYGTKLQFFCHLAIMYEDCLLYTSRCV